MKSSRKASWALAMGLVLVAAVAFAQSVKPVHMHEHGMDGGLLRYSEALDLTDAQQAQMKDIMTKEKPAMKPLMQQMFQAHKAMDDLLASGPFDEAKVRALAGQQAQNFTEMTVQKARIDSEMLQVLTADQKTKLASIRQKHEERMQNHQAGTPPEPPTD